MTVVGTRGAKSAGSYVMLCLAPEDALATHESEQTGCHEDKRSWFRHELLQGRRNHDASLEIRDAALGEVDRLHAVQCEVASARKEDGDTC